MKKYQPYLVFWLTYAITLYLGSLFFPGDIVLGNFRFGAIIAALVSGLALVLLFWSVWEFLKDREIKPKNTFLNLGLIYVLNSFLVWIVSRLPQLAGLGIAKFYWAFVLAVIPTLVEFAWWNLLKKK